MMYLLRGSLPWQGLKVYGKEDKYQKILQKKKETPVEELCKNFPAQFAEFVTYVKSLNYTDDPNYEFLKGLLNQIGKDHKFEFDNQYDWIKVESVKQEKVTENTDKTSNKALRDLQDKQEEE